MQPAGYQGQFMSNHLEQITLTLFLLSGIAGRADDWPQWRGPNRDGVWSETGILKSFPQKGLKIKWRAAVGPGWSSPVVAHGRGYVTDAELMRPKAKERIHCLDAATGKALWSYAYDAGYPDSAFSQGPGRGPTATPLVHGQKVYTVGRVDLYCFDAVKGQ